MRPMSTQTLAREAAVKLAASTMPDGGCTRRARLWSVLERAHRAARRPEDAAEVIGAIREEFCGECPARLACHQLAADGDYTGLAAGAAYEKGERKKSTWTVTTDSKKRRAAARRPPAKAS